MRAAAAAAGEGGLGPEPSWALGQPVIVLQDAGDVFEAGPLFEALPGVLVNNITVTSLSSGRLCFSRDLCQATGSVRFNNIFFVMSFRVVFFSST